MLQKTKVDRIFVVETLIKTKSPKATQRAFNRKFAPKPSQLKQLNQLRINGQKMDLFLTIIKEILDDEKQRALQKTS